MSAADIVGIITQLLGAVGGVGIVGGLFKYGIDKRASRAAERASDAQSDATGISSSKVLTDTAVGLLAPMREQMELQRREMADAETRHREAETRHRDELAQVLAEVRSLKAWTVALVHALNDAGLDVPPQPPVAAT